MCSITAKKILVLLATSLPVSLFASDQCVPVKNFIVLGKSAERCVTEIKLGKEKADDVLAKYGFCTNVRDARDDVEKRLHQLPPATMNGCAKQNLQAYTDAATSLQRLYQIELQLH